MSAYGWDNLSSIVVNFCHNTNITLPDDVLPPLASCRHVFS